MSAESVATDKQQTQPDISYFRCREYKSDPFAPCRMVSHAGATPFIPSVYVRVNCFISIALTHRGRQHMEIDERIERAKDLIRKREEIDAELAALFGISVRNKKIVRCSKCGEEGHNSKTCPAQQSSAEAQ
jgi:hypothetical protein